MFVKIKLFVENHSKNNIFFICDNGKVPESDIDGCPKNNVMSLLSNLTGYSDLDSETSWIMPELIDTEYDDVTKTVYILYVCRVPEKMELKSPLQWVELNKMTKEIERVKGLF